MLLEPHGLISLVSLNFKKPLFLVNTTCFPCFPQDWLAVLHAGQQSCFIA